MELRSYQAILRRRWRIIAITAAVTLVVVGIGTLLMPSMYVASTTLRFSNAANLAMDSVNSDSVMYTTRLMNTYSRIATSERVLDDVRGRLGMRQAPQVKVDLPANTDLMVISVQNEDPAVAAAAANAVADIVVTNVAQAESSAAVSAREALGNQLSQLQNDLQQASDATDSTARGTLDLKQQQYARLSDQYQRAQLSETLRSQSVSVLEPVRVPEAPALPRRALNMAIALVIGLIGGTALAFVVENLDTRVYTTSHLEEVVDASILAALPVAPVSRGRAFFQTNSPELEALRRISTELFHARHTTLPRLVLVTSAVPEEGKSTVVANLGVLIARTGRSVAIVDCDLRLPAQHEMFSLPNGVGLTSYLNGQTSLDRVAQSGNVSGLTVITSGPTPPNPAELIGGAKMRTFLEEVVGRYDVAVLDTPSLLAVVDALPLVPVVDRVLLVVRRAQASAEAVWAAREQLVAARARAISVVLNRAAPDDRSYAYYTRVSSA